MFIAQQVASQLIRTLPRIIEALAKHDGALADQLRRAGASVLLNLSEGNRRVGRDRLHFFRIAAGSAAEVRAVLEVGEAFGYVDAVDLSGALGLIARQLALLWGLTHKRR